MAAPYQTPYYGAQGVQLFGLNNLTSPSSVMTMTAAMSFAGIGGNAADVKVSNLDSGSYEEFFKGLIDPGSPNGDVVYNFNSSVHQWLDTMFAKGVGGTTQWFIGAADATLAPTITGTIASGDQVLTPPKGATSPKHWTRSGFYFYAYVKEFSKSVQTGQFIKAKLTLRISGAITPCYLGVLATI